MTRYSTYLWLTALTAVLAGWLAPLHFPLWTGFHNELPTILAAAVMGLIALTRIERATPTLLVSGLLLLAALMQRRLGIVHYTGDVALVGLYVLMGGFALLFAASAPVSHAPAHRQQLLAVIVIGAMITAGLCVYQFAGWAESWSAFASPLNESWRAFGNLAQPNQAATLLLMGWMALSFLWWDRMLKPWHWWLGSLLLAVGVATTQSRTGALSWLVCCAGLAFVAWIKRDHAPSTRPPWRLGHLLATSAVFALSFVAAWWYRSEKLRVSPGLEYLSNDSGRIVLWQQLIASWQYRPWLGYGWLQTAEAQQMGALTVAAPIQTQYGHNIVIDLITWFGIPLGILATLAIAYWLLKVFVLGASSDPLRLGGLLVLIPFGVHSMLELPHAYSYFLLPVFTLIGYQTALNTPMDVQSTVGGTRFFHRGLVGVALSVYVALGWKAFNDYRLFEEDFRVVRMESARIGEPDPNYQRPQLKVLDQLDELSQAMRLQARPDMPAEDVDMLLRVVRRYPWPPLFLRTTLALGLNGRTDEAEQLWTSFWNMVGDNHRVEGLANLATVTEQRYPQLHPLLTHARSLERRTKEPQ